MHAAVVTTFHAPPQYADHPEPVATGDDDVVVRVLAAALHPRVRSAADGTHYESTGALPLVPGVDGVGELPDGGLVYFVLPETTLGSMAERTVIDRRRAAPLPAGIDPVTIAAAMNPAMSSWVALRRRIDFAPGARVLVLGATGNAGSLAVPIAKHLGASHVVAAGRNQQRLDALTSAGADQTVTLTDDRRSTAERLAAAASEVDVVIDYLWGSAAAVAMPALLKGRRDRGRPITWIEIGSMAGLELAVESQWLRAARLQIVGSGQGSVPTRDIVAELPALAAHLGDAGYALGVAETPLSAVEAAWTDSLGRSDRIVFVP